MVGDSRPSDGSQAERLLDAAARWVLAVIAVSAVIMLAACGSTAAGGAGHPASAAPAPPRGRPLRVRRGHAALCGRPESGPGRSQPARGPPP